MTHSKEEILQAIRHLAKDQRRNWLTFKEFIKSSRLSRKQFFKHFTKWNDAVMLAGLQPLDRTGRPDQKKGYSRDDLLQSARQLAAKMHRDILTEAEFTEATGISYRPIHRVFGSWNSFLAEAGLQPHPMQKNKIPDAELFNDYIRVWSELGNRHPPYQEFASRAPYSINTYAGRRFGGFKGFRRAAVLFGISEGLMTPDVSNTLPDDLDSTPERATSVYDALDDRPVLGEEIDFKGLQHAPVNENGVVFLFGILAHDLGFIVESVQAGYPDCEAKRRLKNSRWQRVKIEFEYLSSNFLRHKHDPNNCDLIVCWRHDWKDCPVEVLSLKDVVKKQTKPSRDK